MSECLKNADCDGVVYSKVEYGGWNSKGAHINGWGY